MTQSRCWLAAAVVVLFVTALPSPATASEKSKSRTHAPKQHKTKSKLTLKTYPVANLIDATESHDADVLIRAIVRAVKPDSWGGKGGSATIDYFPKTRSLVIKQTAAGHRQVDVVLKTVTAIYSETPAPLPCVKCAASDKPETQAKTAPSGQENAYGHLVLDNVRVNAMGINCTIKRVRVMYKGDSNLADAAKGAVANGEAGKPQGMANVLNAVLEGMGVSSTPCGGPACAAPPCSAAPIYASGAYAIPAPNAGTAWSYASAPAGTTAPGCTLVTPRAQPSATPPGPSSAIPSAAPTEKKDEKGQPQKTEMPRSPNTK